MIAEREIYGYSSVTPKNIGYQQCLPNHSFGPAVREHFLIHYVLSGYGTYTVGGKTYRISPGESFFIKPGEVTFYSADEKEPWHYVWVSFYAEKSMFDFLPYIIRNSRLSAVMTEADMLLRGGNMFEPSAIAKIWNVIACLLDGSELNNENDYAERAADMIKRRFSDELTVASIANDLGLDRSYFSNIFKERFGISPKKFICAYRMEKAYDLLESKMYSVSVIALNVGYGDVFSFSRAFKSYFGFSPAKHGSVGYHRGPFYNIVNKEN